LTCTTPGFRTTQLTTKARDTLGHVDDRSPAIIPPEVFGDRLDPDTRDEVEVLELLDGVPEPVLSPRIVTDRVSSVRNSCPDDS
jgi:putative SOS response-associated peptidase YedK